MNRYLLFLYSILISIPAFSQKEIRTYYNPQKTALQEKYYVDQQDNSIYVGKYQRYWEN